MSFYKRPNNKAVGLPVSNDINASNTWITLAWIFGLEMVVIPVVEETQAPELIAEPVQEEDYSASEEEELTVDAGENEDDGLDIPEGSEEEPAAGNTETDADIQTADGKRGSC